MVVILAAPAVVAYQNQCGGRSCVRHGHNGVPAKGPRLSDFPQKILHAQDSYGAAASATSCRAGGWSAVQLCALAGIGLMDSRDLPLAQHGERTPLEWVRTACDVI
ncbi:MULTISPECIES: hypothetical protein [unclassified Kitasatospora]|uniref:hypothetical protein n=1 Tax=unclassified Kitasatospora TaxID=2633591 RepID=UPI003825DE65